MKHAHTRIRRGLFGNNFFFALHRRVYSRARFAVIFVLVPCSYITLDGHLRKTDVTRPIDGYFGLGNFRTGVRRLIFRQAIIEHLSLERNFSKKLRLAPICRRPERYVHTHT